MKRKRVMKSQMETEEPLNMTWTSTSIIVHACDKLFVSRYLRYKVHEFGNINKHAARLGSLLDTTWLHETHFWSQHKCSNPSWQSVCICVNVILRHQIAFLKTMTNAVVIQGWLLRPIGSTILHLLMVPIQRQGMCLSNRKILMILVYS